MISLLLLLSQTQIFGEFRGVEDALIRNYDWFHLKPTE